MMLHCIAKRVLCVFPCIAVMACSSDRLQGTVDAGVLSVSIETDGRVVAAGSNGSFIETGYLPSEGSVSLTMTSVSGEYSHTWTDADEFPHEEYYFAGSYTLQAMSGNTMIEGFDTPAFDGEETVEVLENQASESVVEMTVANALVKVVFTEEAVSAFGSIAALVHSEGGMYHSYGPEESRYLCLNPGRTDFSLDIKLADGRTVNYPAYTLSSAEAATLYVVSVDCKDTPSGPEVTVSGVEGDRSVTLSEDFIDSPAPVMTSSWDRNVTLELSEGNIPEDPYIVTVESRVPLSSLILSVLSLSLSEDGFPAEVDLLHLAPGQDARLRELGLTYDVGPAGGTVDYTALLGRLVYLTPESAMSAFSLLAIGNDGKGSEPLSLYVRTMPVEISVGNIYPVTMGVDVARVDVACGESGFRNHVEVEVLDAESGKWAKVSDLNISETGTGEYSLEFKVPSGSLPVDVRVLYCEEVRATLKVPRKMPPFRIEVDAYATMAGVKVVPEDPSLLESISSQTRVYVNGNEAPLYLQLKDQGIFSVIGLSPNTTYTFKATMMSAGVADIEFTPEVTVTTEGTPQLPNHDFEDRSDGVKYEGLKSGGRYSQTVVEIFNWQHSTDIEQEVPKSWANTNAKTFSMASSNHNTWYMQPSASLTRDPVFSQSFAVELSCVGFDPHGKPIPDYTQTGQPYLDYSPVVPEIAYRAAGKIFLGSYNYDPVSVTETYNEGIAWGSRPSSLNGYYRYFPCEGDRSDCGLAIVEVLGQVDGKEVVIASGSVRLELASSYTAFSAPLSYRMFGVRATRIKVMFSASSHIGTIAEETRNVVTVSDPRSATSVGGRLWIDNVTLAY